MQTTHVGEYCARAQELVLAEIETLAASQTTVAQLRDMMLDYPLRAAKGLRPAICIAACRALGGSVQAALPSAVAFELLHNAFLIHDDVEDESLFRRGEPTLQRSHGASIAMNVADAMLALALAPLLDNTKVIGLGPALEILQRVREMVLVTVEGQAIELGWIRANTWHFDGEHRHAYEEMVVKKTAHYSFITPIEVGVLVAEGPEEVRHELTAYAKHLGIAFQITDDLLNLRTELCEYGKEACGDLWEGKRTLMLLHALHRAEGTDEGHRALQILGRPRPIPTELSQGRTAQLRSLHAAGHLDDIALNALLGSPTATEDKSDDDIEALLRFVHRHGGIEYAREIARAHTSAAEACLRSCRSALTPSIHRDFLDQLPLYATQRLK